MFKIEIILRPILVFLIAKTLLFQYLLLIVNCFELISLLQQYGAIYSHPSHYANNSLVFQWVN